MQSLVRRAQFAKPRPDPSVARSFVAPQDIAFPCFTSTCSLSAPILRRSQTHRPQGNSACCNRSPLAAAPSFPRLQIGCPPSNPGTINFPREIASPPASSPPIEWGATPDIKPQILPLSSTINTQASLYWCLVGRRSGLQILTPSGGPSEMERAGDYPNPKRHESGKV